VVKDKKCIVFIRVFLLLVGTAVSSFAENQEPVTGILGAIPEERNI
jgi:hypothetical protein